MKFEQVGDYGDEKIEKRCSFPAERSKDMACEMYVKEIKRLGNQDDAERFLGMITDEGVREYRSVEDFSEANPDYTKAVEVTLSADEKDALKEYSGFNYKWINSAMRGIWDYELLGAKTDEAERRFLETAKVINGAIEKAPNVEEDFMVFRGTNLDSFRGYGVETLADLDKMKGQFHLEKGFLSTSIVEEDGFAGRKEFDDIQRGACNITMRYKVAAGTHDGILLAGSDLTYSEGQSEYLIKSGSLAYISKVEISEDERGAVLDCVLVPSQFYDSGSQE